MFVELADWTLRMSLAGIKVILKWLWWNAKPMPRLLPQHLWRRMALTVILDTALSLRLLRSSDPRRGFVFRIPLVLIRALLHVISLTNIGCSLKGHRSAHLFALQGNWLGCLHLRVRVKCGLLVYSHGLTRINWCDESWLNTKPPGRLKREQWSSLNSFTVQFWVDSSLFLWLEYMFDSQPFVCLFLHKLLIVFFFLDWIWLNCFFYFVLK